VVGIGAGEGALKPLRTILAGLPSGRGLAVVLVHHPQLAKGKLTTLLKPHTTLAVVEAADGMAVQADRIHVMPPDKFLNITAGRLSLKEPVHCNGLLMPVDHFFCALAAESRNRCCGILLSGAGGDGTLGLSEIRAAGGRTIAEDPRRARRSEMPQGAVAAGMVDAVLPAGDIAGAIAALAERIAAQGGRAAAPEPGQGLAPVLEILRTRAGHDFRCYKPGTLVRRIRRRMTLGRIATLEDYARHLQDHPDEAGLLQKDLLIGVTEFFRQPQAWETLARKVIAPLVENAERGPIRVWITGCAAGREVYSLAMLLAEETERAGRKRDFQIFATDADETALAAARSGAYPAEEIGPNVSPERLERFFTRRDNRYQVIKALRERIVFAAQNLTADPPFSRLDLIVCRNLLIYLDQGVQRKIMALFHFALRDGGFLFLGNAETIGDREDLFEPVAKKWRIYRRIGVGRSLGADFPVQSAAPPCTAPAKYPPVSISRPSLTATAQQVLLDRFAPACVMIDRKLQVLYLHGAIENYLSFPKGELTTRVTDMAREGLRARLQGLIAKCIESGRTASFTTRTRRDGKSLPVKTTVIPLRQLRGSEGLLLITFEDQRFPSPRSGGAAADRGDVQQLVDELKITREELQSTIDQLESSNDQLKASNEEVMAANEELQSANEEMETSKEELQSLNEELNTINLRLQEKVDELESTHNDVLNLLASSNIATVFLDKAFRIKRYTPAVTGLMSLIPSDLERPLGDILLRFADPALLDDARLVLTDLTPRVREVRADDGRWHIRRITPYRTQDDRIEGVVLTFVDVAELKQAEESLRAALDRAAWLARFPEENPAPVVRIAAEGPILYCNPASERDGDWACSPGGALPSPFLPHVAAALVEGTEIHREIQLGERFYGVTFTPFPAESYLNVYGRDITERVRAEETLRRSEDRLKRAQEIAHLGSWELDLADSRLTWSDEVYRIFGLPPQSFAATYEAFLDRVHPDDRMAVDAAYAESLRENRDSYEMEHRVIRKDTGEIRVVQERCQHIRDAAGRIVRSVGMVHDITERKHAGEALLRLNDELEARVAAQTAEIRRTYGAVEGERQRFYDVLETLPAYVVLLTPDYQVPFANRTFRERFGEGSGKRCYEHLFGRTEPCEVCETYSVLNTGEPHRWEWVGPDNRTYDVFDYPFTDSEGAPFILEMGIDITEVKQAGAALREANETLERRVAERTAQSEAARAEAEEGKRRLESTLAALRASEARVRRKMESILSPAGDIGELELADIIDVAAIQSLMADFYTLAGIPMSIIDLEGRVIVGAGWQEICTQFHRVHPDACRHCVESDTELTVGVPPGQYKLYKCKNHLWDVATPIVVGGRHLANIFSGQFFFADERVDYDLYRAQAGRYGFAEADYLAALEKVPRLDRQQVEIAMAFFMKFADLISQMSYANIKLARSLAERDALMTSLAESEERLRLFIEHAPTALAMFDRQMRYLSVSRRWRSDYGLGETDLSGRCHYDVIPDVPAQWQENHRRGLAGEVLRAEADRFERADGTVIWTRWEIRPWRDPAGEVGGIIIFSEEITALMQASEALKSRSEQLAAANKELESFSYSVSHDLQAPLRAIDGYSRMILRKHAAGLDAEALAKFTVIRESTRMMGLLIDDLLAFSRLGKAHLSVAALEMEHLVREVWQEIRAAHPDRNLTLTVSALPPGRGDRGLIRQVLVNILANAVKFTRERPEARIEVGGTLQNGECIYSVRDNGIGFDMQYHDKMFGVFQRLHGAGEFEGTGVGLAIVQRIVLRHGGRVWAEGEVGQGACFCFSLPL
jgi:two-component system CheB/CheR fusion protein